MKRYCPSCSNTSDFDGEVCKLCQRVERNCKSPVAQKYVAGWWTDHRMLVPQRLLKNLQDAV
jgi:hypothetical protein